MHMSKYIDLVAKSYTDDKPSKADLKNINNTAVYNAKRYVLDLEEEINALEGSIESAKCSTHFSLEGLIAKQMRLEVTQSKLERAKKLQKQLF